MRIERTNILLIVIIIIAAGLRLQDLPEYPLGLHNDEVMNGYVGRYILENGVDLYGNRSPVLYFDNFGDYPNVMPMYLSGLATYLFGVNTWAIRAPIALAGTLSVGLLYLVGKELFGRRAGMMAAAILAILPWHIVLSRATAEGVTASAVFLLGLWLLLLARRQAARYWVILSFICFGLTYLLYPSYRVFVPLAVLPAVYLFKDRVVRVFALGGFGVFGLLTLIISQTAWGRGRYDQTSVFTFLDVLKIRLTQLIYQDEGVPLFITRMFHNKIWVSLREVVNQYLEYFNGEYLFTRGGLPGRYSLPDQGLVYLSILGFLILGLWLWMGTKKGVKNKQQDHNGKLYFFYLLLASPLPAALTMEDAPNVHRSLLLGIMTAMWMGVVINYVVSKRFFLKRLSLAILIILLMFELGYFWHQYRIHGVIFQAEARASEMEAVVNYITVHEDEYDVIVAPAQNQLPLRYLWEKKYFDKSLAGKFSSGIYIERIEKIVFSRESCPEVPSDPNRVLKPLLLQRFNCPVPEAMYEIETFKQLNGQTTYRALTIKGE